MPGGERRGRDDERADLSHVQAAVCDGYGVSRDALCGRGHRGSEAEAAARYLCKRLTGLSLSDLGQGFGGVGASAVCNTASEVKRRLDRERGLARLDASRH